MIRVRPALALLALAIAAATAAADVVHLKDGGAIEGKVVAEDKTQVTIDTRFGRQTIERSRIERVVKGKTAQEELAEREAALEKSGTAAQWFELVEFAGSKGLKKDRERLLDRTLKVDPDHEGANRAKGRVKHEGRWMTPAERDEAVRAAEAAQMLARGLVLFEGRWVSAEERTHLERGEELVGGKWLSPDDAKRAKGLTKLGDQWIPQTEEVPLRRAIGFASESKLPLETASGDHVVAATTFGKEHLEALRDACELGFAASAKSLHESDSDFTWLGGQKLLVVVLPAREEFGSFCRFFARDEPKVDQRWAEGVAQVEGFFWWDPTGTSATYKSARGLDDTIAHSVHHLGHVLLNRHGFNFKFLPTWLDEGYAAWLEHEVLKRNVISCISSRRYGADGVRKDELVSRTTWFDDAKKQIAQAADPPLSPLLRKDLTTITPDEVAKSMVLIDWLIRERQDAFLKFLKALREAWPKGVASPMSPEARNAHQKAFDALGTPADLLDRELRAAIAAGAKTQAPAK